VFAKHVPNKLVVIKHFTVYFLLFLQPYFMHAQQPCEFILTGNVSDADTKEPLEYAAIQVKGKGHYTFTDSLGNYRLNGLCAGELQIVITHYACEPISFKIKISGNTLHNFVLPHKTNQLREITVTDKFTINGLGIKETVNAKALFNTKGLSFAEQLIQTNGVALLQTGNNIFKPIINGLHGNRLLIINNGVRLESQQWGAEHAPEIDPFTINEITVIKGAGALKYGSDALAGAIITNAKPLPVNGKFNGEWFAGYQSNNRQFSGHVMVEHNVKNLPALSWRLQLSGRKAGNTKTPNYYLWNSGMDELNGSLTIGYRKPNYAIESYTSIFNSTIGIFLGSQIGNITDLRQAILLDKPLFNKDEFSYNINRPRQDVSHFTQKLKYIFYKDPRHLVHTQITFQQNNRKEFDLAQISDKPELDLQLNTLQADAWYEHKHDFWLHNYGISNTVQENIWSGSRFFIPNFRQTVLAAYHISHYSNNRFELEGGLRYDYRHLQTFRNNNGILTQNVRNWNNVSLSANAQYKMTNGYLLSVNTGIAWRAPNVNELYTNGLHHGTSSFEIGDANLANEVGYKIGISIQKSWFDSLLKFEGYVYNNYIIGFINLLPDTQPTLTIRGAFPTFRFKQTNANLSGIDAAATLKITRNINYKLQYSILYAYDLQLKNWLQQMPGNRLFQQFQVNLPYTDKENPLSVNLQWQSVFMQTRIPDAFIDYLPPPLTYHLFHFYINTNVQRGQIQVGSNNIFNTTYREYLNRFRYFNDETGRNFYIKLIYHF
jgi:iron complex outermembrane receptor protein